MLSLFLAFLYIHFETRISALLNTLICYYIKYERADIVVLLKWYRYLYLGNMIKKRLDVLPAF